MTRSQTVAPTVGLVKAHTIPPELIINEHKASFPVGDGPWLQRGSRRVEVAGLGDRRQITAIFADTLSGAFLPMQVLYQGKSDRYMPSSLFQMVSTSITHQTTGQTKRQ